MTFILYTQLDLDPEEQFLFDKYALHDRVVYNSEAFIEHLEAADQHREDAAEPQPDLKKDEDPLDAALAHIGNVAYHSFSALWHNIAGRLELQLTIQNLLDGINIESQDLEEILTIEHLVRQAGQYIADYLRIGLTFDGTEELHEH